MILYNIRANGPFEYDKFILNIGQLYNLVQETKKDYDASTIKQEFDRFLTDHIHDYIQPEEKYGNAIYTSWNWQKEKDTDSWLNKLAAIRKAVLL